MIAAAGEQQIERRRQSSFGVGKHCQQHALATDNRRANQLVALADEAAKLVQNLQDSWNKKDGTQWATSFAPEHDYVVFTGRFLPKMTPKDNANAHQQVFDGMYKNVDLALHVAKIRSLTPEIGVVHIEGYKHAKGKLDERQGEMMITTAKGALSIASRTDPNVGVDDPSSPRTGDRTRRVFALRG